MNALVKLEAATVALAEARTITEVMALHGEARTLVELMKIQKAGIEHRNQVAEFVLKTERRAGEMLAEMDKNAGVAGTMNGRCSSGGFMMKPPEDDRPKLSDLGVNKVQSSRWQAIAAVPEECFVQHIAEVKAAGEELTTAGVLRLAKELKRQEMVQEKRARPLPLGQYRVICADPPWQYSNSGFDEAADNLYPTMPLDDICALPVSTLATPDSVLFLWATNPLLPEALQVLDAWGFTYKTNMAWIKDAGRGKGWYLRSKHELLLIGTRAETPHPITRPDSCFAADRGSVHSRKPQLAYDIIESMYPAPRIELFARTPRSGWDVWGNEPNL